MGTNEFGTYLKSLRNKRGFTLESLGKKVDLSKSYLSHIENGKRDAPSPAVLKRLSKALDANYEELMIKAGYWNEKFDEDDRNRFEEIYNENADMNDKISSILKIVADDDGYFPDYLHKDIFRIFGEHLSLSEGNNYSHAHDEFYRYDYIDRPDPEEYYGEQYLREIHERFNTIYNYTSVKNGVIKYTGANKDRDDFLLELLELTHKHELADSVEEREIALGHPLHIDLNDILDTSSLTVVSLNNNILTRDQRNYILGMLSASEYLRNNNN